MTDESLDIVRRMIVAIGDDPARDGLKDTPSRVVRSWREVFGGYANDPALHLATTFDVGGDQMIHVNGIEFFSTCEHHMLPFHGTVDVAYIPRDRVVGLSKFARVVDGYARRLQVQERLTNQVADAIVEHVSVLGAAVRVRAVHQCMIARGARTRATMTTTALRGIILEDDTVRREWMSALPG